LIFLDAKKTKNAIFEDTVRRPRSKPYLQKFCVVTFFGAFYFFIIKTKSYIIPIPIQTFEDPLPVFPKLISLADYCFYCQIV